jgi:carboxymethylenebutenolidase
VNRTRIVIACASLMALTACPKRGYLEDHSAHMSSADLAAPRVGAPSSQAQDNLNFPPSNDRAPARLAASQRHSEWVKIAWEPGSRDSLMAWVVYPMTSNAKTPVVVVVHEIFGLSTWVRGVADQVAADGFIAIAPDLESRVRGGPSTTELTGDSARKLIVGVNTAERNKGIVATANYAMSLPSAAARYAVIGYCWGGQTVWAHAVHGGTKGYSGGVAFYGAFPYNVGQPPAVSIDADSLKKINKPLMLLNGANDARIVSQIPALDSLLKSWKKDYSYQNYAHASHGFLRQQDDPHFVRDSSAADGRRRDTETETADVAATKDGWPRTIAFLKKNLGVK